MSDSLKTVVALFDDLAQARAAVQDLRDAGYQDNEVSLAANAAADEYSRLFDENGKYYQGSDVYSEQTPAVVGAEVGALVGGLGGLLLSLTFLPIPGVGPIIAAGPITATLVGAIGGALAGGLIGALTTLGVPEEHAEVYAEGLRRGGTLVVIKTAEDRLGPASEILNSHAPINVETRVEHWKLGGWSRFDADARPYTVDQIAEERKSYASASV